MNKSFSFLKTAKIVLAYAALVFALAFLFSSCSIARREGTTSPCNNKDAFSGYGADNQNHKVHIVKRNSY